MNTVKDEVSFLIASVIVIALLIGATMSFVGYMEGYVAGRRAAMEVAK